FFDSPASMSLHEEATGAALRPAMGIFNNLVMYDQHVAQNRPGTIVADLATAWTWNEEGTALTFSLRLFVKWHDGRSFTAAEFKPNEVIRTVRNPDYWKPGRPYLDGIDWEIMKDNTTRNLAFIAGKSDIASPYGMTVPLLNDVVAQAPAGDLRADFYQCQPQ